MLVVTLGDPLSVTVECLLALKSLWNKPQKGPVVFIGAYEQWRWQCRSLGETEPSPFAVISSFQDIRDAKSYFLDIAPGRFAKGTETLTLAERGEIATLALESLRGFAPRGRLAVVTAPIDKYACSAAGFTYPGQTEFFCDLWQAPGIMILAGPKLRVALATNHVRLADVTGLITPERICQKLAKLSESLQAIFQIKRPRIAVCALNPHAGDQGLFGDEDQRIIAPAVELMRQQGMDVVGPKPADTLFFQAWSGAYDAVLAMYHDQGLGPLKALHFYDAVNVTGGLPHLRVSPDHGPASDLFGRRKADPESFRCALAQALSYLGW